MKDKHSSEVIYALADYKQLVLAYRTKHDSLVKSVTFWKTSVVWICVFLIFFVLTAMFLFTENIKSLEKNKNNQEFLNAKVSAISEELSRTKKDLAVAREELSRKEELVKLLEKNISTASKNLLEKMLIEQEEPAAK